jgi:hypothetical protein
MLKALLPAIMKLFAYLLVLHLGIDSLLLPPDEGNILYPVWKGQGNVTYVLRQYAFVQKISYISSLSVIYNKFFSIT